VCWPLRGGRDTYTQKPLKIYRKKKICSVCTYGEICVHCKPGPGLNSTLTPEGRKQLTESNMLHLGRIQVRKSKEIEKYDYVPHGGIFDLAEPHSTLWSQMGVEVGTGLTVW
jgi:hypothetical protein